MKTTALALAAAAGLCLAAAAPRSQAQITVDIGPPPVCPYGYYDYAPYPCAPYGYYGTEWFVNGAFIGIGPWFHGPAGFHGYVNTHLHPQFGYHGPLPQVGERAVRSVARMPSFHGNQMRDGGGHEVRGR
jgi:hypothetical protein